MMQWKSITPNFSGSNTAMRNASSSIAQAANTFDGINRLRIAQEQQDIENARAEKAFNLQEQEFGMKQDAYAREIQGQQEAGTYLDIYSREGEAGLDAFLAQNGNPQTSAGNEAIAKIMGWDLQSQQLAQQQANADRTYNLAVGERDRQLTNQKAYQEGIALIASPNTTDEQAQVIAARIGLTPNQTNQARNHLKNSKSGNSVLKFTPDKPLQLDETKFRETMSSLVKSNTGEASNLEDSKQIVALTDAIKSNSHLLGNLSTEDLSEAVNSYLLSTDNYNSFRSLGRSGIDTGVEEDINDLKQGKGPIANAIFNTMFSKNGNTYEGMSLGQLSLSGMDENQKSQVMSALGVQTPTNNVSTSSNNSSTTPSNSLDITEEIVKPEATKTIKDITGFSNNKVFIDSILDDFSISSKEEKQLLELGYDSNTVDLLKKEFRKINTRQNRENIPVLGNFVDTNVNQERQNVLNSLFPVSPQEQAKFDILKEIVNINKDNFGNRNISSSMQQSLLDLGFTDNEIKDIQKEIKKSNKPQNTLDKLFDKYLK